MKELLESLSPSPRIVLSYMRNNIGALDAFSEWIDNALDQLANWIRFQISRDEVIVKDNGNGCNNLANILQLGRHVPPISGRRGIGINGIGAKEAMMAIGRCVAITSIINGEERRIELDWKLVSECETWDEVRERFPSFKHRSNAPNGTEIRVSHLHRKIYGVSDLMDEIGIRYKLAIDEGRKLEFVIGDSKPKLVTPFTYPEFELKIPINIQHNGISIEGIGGILKAPNKNPRRQFMYAHKYRVIQETDAPCKGSGSSPRFAAYPILKGDEWELQKLKNGLINEDQKEFVTDSLHQLFAPVLETLRTEAQEIECTALASKLTQTLNEKLGRRHLNPGNNKTPSGDEKSKVESHRKSRKKPNPKDKKNATGFLISFSDLHGDAIAKISETLVTEIQFNKNHSRIKTALKLQEKREESIFEIAAGIVADYIVHQEERERSKAAQRILKSVMNSEDKNQYMHLLSEILR